MDARPPRGSRGRSIAPHRHPAGGPGEAPDEGFSFERFASLFARADIVAKRLHDAHSDSAVAAVRPPRVTFTQPPPISARADCVTLFAHVDAQTPSSELRAFVDGRPVATQPLGAAAADATIDVPLAGESNVVSLVAFDAAGRASNPLIATIATQAAATRPDIGIVAAGIGWYPGLPDGDQLEAPVNDAHAIAETFAARAGDGQALCRGARDHPRGPRGHARRGRARARRAREHEARRCPPSRSSRATARRSARAATWFS